MKDVAKTPPKLTEVTLERFLPVIVTEEPTPVDLGVKEVIVGLGNTGMLYTYNMALAIIKAP